MLKPPLGSQLILGHPLTRGLAGYWLMNEGGGNIVADLSGNIGEGEMGGNSLFTARENGIAYEGTASGDGILLPTGYDPLAGLSSFSVVIYIRPSTVTVDGGIFYSDTHALNRPIVSWFDTAGVKPIGVIVTTTGGTTGAIYSSSGVTINNWYSIVLTYSGTSVRLYINGIEDTGGAFPAALTGTLIPASGRHCIANQNTLASKGLVGFVDHTALYNRALSANEIASLYADPYQMFRQEPIELWAAASPAAAGGIPIFRRRREAC